LHGGRVAHGDRLFLVRPKTGGRRADPPRKWKNLAESVVTAHERDVGDNLGTPSAGNRRDRLRPSVGASDLL
jgi:hypothetical protein